MEKKAINPITLEAMITVLELFNRQEVHNPYNWRELERFKLVEKVGPYYELTDKGNTYALALLNIPLPVMKWVYE